MRQEAEHTVMHERILELIIYLVNEIRNEQRSGPAVHHGDTPPLDGGIQYSKSGLDLESLTRRGYTSAEISTAFSWLFDHLTLGENLVVGANSPHSHRILHEIERLAIGREAQGYLIQLRELGLISDDDVEMVIERAMITGLSQAGISEIKSLIAAVLFEHDESARLANRMTWNISDTIH
jgi:uncharacterized protein Smg (DUF494 family)